MFETKLNHVRHLLKKCLLVTLNVKTLYTNMLNNERIKAVREAYDKHPSKTVSTKIIIIFTKHIEFLDTMVYKDQQHKIQTTTFRKPTG